MSSSMGELIAVGRGFDNNVSPARAGRRRASIQRKGTEVITADHGLITPVLRFWRHPAQVVEHCR